MEKLTPEEIRALIKQLEAEGADALRKHYSLGMWALCANAAQALRQLTSDRQN